MRLHVSTESIQLMADSNSDIIELRAILKIKMNELAGYWDDDIHALVIPTRPLWERIMCPNCEHAIMLPEFTKQSQKEG